MNSLNGSIPNEFARLLPLKKLQIDRNKLSGSVATELGLFSAQLSLLWLFNNRLTGTIPTDLCNMSVIADFTIGGNFLTGTVPTELGLLLSSLMFLWLQEIF